MTEADFMTALHGYIVAVTGLAGTRIFRGNQSRMVLPKSGSYCIYTPIIRQRRGTNVYDFDAEGLPDNKNGVDTISALVLIDVQVDFYSTDSMAYAQILEIASRSYMGSDYFKTAGKDVRVCTAQAPRNLTGIDESNQYEERWSVTITAEVCPAITNNLPWFEDVQFRHKIAGSEPPEYEDGIINVDAEFPPSAE